MRKSFIDIVFIVERRTHFNYLFLILMIPGNNYGDTNSSQSKVKLSFIIHCSIISAPIRNCFFLKIYSLSLQNLRWQYSIFWKKLMGGNFNDLFQFKLFYCCFQENILITLTNRLIWIFILLNTLIIFIIRKIFIICIKTINK